MAYTITHSAKGFLQGKKEELANANKTEKKLEGYQLQVQKDKAEGIAQSINAMKDIERQRKRLMNYSV
jgi:hypothetical protein